MLEKDITLVRFSQCSDFNTTILSALLVCIAILPVLSEISLTPSILYIS